MHTIAVIDRFPILRAGLCSFLKDHFLESCILMTGSPAGFADLFPGQKPGLFILGMDKGLNINSFGSIRMLKEQFPDALIVIYDEKADPALALLYIKAGVSGYLSKQDSLEELLLCIRQVISGEKYICRQVADLHVSLNLKKKKKTGGLSPREYEVASYLCQGMKVSWIAETLGTRIGTISTFKTKIFKKLKIENILQLKAVIHDEYVN